MDILDMKATDLFKGSVNLPKNWYVLVIIFVIIVMMAKGTIKFGKGIVIVLILGVVWYLMFKGLIT